MKYYLITDSQITFMTENGQVTILGKSHQNFDRIRNIIMDNNIDDKDSLVTELVDIPSAITKYSRGYLRIEEDYGKLQFYYEDQLIDNSLSRRILAMFNKGVNFEYFVTFFINLMENPIESSRNELYDFLSSSSLPITEDGCFLAYKVVDKNFKDLYTGQFDNSVGQTVEVDPETVDTDRNNVCSTGLHFASFAYLKNYDGDSPDNNIIIVKINPKHVVSIPVDYSFQKGRCWRYEVIGTIPYDELFIKPDFVNTKEENIVTEANPDEKPQDYEDDTYDFDDYDFEYDDKGFVDPQEEVWDSLETEDNEDEDEEDLVDEISLYEKCKRIVRESGEAKWVTIKSSIGLKEGIQIKDLLPEQTIEGYLVKYMLETVPYSETLIKELENIDFSKIKSSRRTNTTSKPKPVVLVYKIDDKELNQLTLYTPRIGTFSYV